jgi:hypothetical protein
LSHSADPKHDLAEHVPGSETFMHFRGIGERKLRGDLNSYRCSSTNSASI